MSPIPRNLNSTLIFKLGFGSRGGGQISTDGKPMMNRLTSSLRGLIKKVSVLALALLIIISPLFLIIDFVTYSPLVLTIWLLSAAYYVFVKSREK